MNESPPRAYTAGEMRAMLLDYMHNMARYWAHVQIAEDEGALYRLEGLMHSVLVMLDGGSSLPAFDLTPLLDEEDKAYHRDNGENWWTSEVINDCQLHDEWNTTRKHSRG